MSRRSLRRPTLRVLLPLLVAAVVFAACETDSNESHDHVNRERRSAGVGTLGRSGDLDSKAQKHAEHLASRRTLAHSNLTSGVSGSWTKLGENVGVGASQAEVHHTFMNSSTHRTHILDRAYDDIGVGVAEGGDGRIYVVEVFRAR